MGTRHLTAVYLDGEYKDAQYGQWDGYPSGQGLTVLNIMAALRRDGRMQEFTEKVRQTQQITEAENRQQWAECGHDGSEWVTMEVSGKHAKRFPEMSRDTGAEILSIIADRPAGLKINREIEFASDGLFCEWVWVVDLDAGTLEGYQGFQESPLPEGERFAFLEEMASKDNDGKYHPCKLVAKWSLDELPSEDDFLLAFKEDEEDEKADE